MGFFEKHKIKIIFSAIVVVSLVLAFLWNSEAPKTQENDTGVTVTERPKKQKKRSPRVTAVPVPSAESAADKSEQEETDGDGAEEVYADETGDAEYSSQMGMELQDDGRDEYDTDPVPAGRPVPAEPQNSEISDNKMTCTLSVRCDTILSNMSQLKKGKEGLIPADGMIFQAQNVVFYEGESAFDVFLREMQKNNIHMEYEKTPAFNTAYVKGINNIYEFDCGAQSGWRYRVNGWIPNYGCSRYEVKNGDVIEWVYTCDSGHDIAKGQ